MCLRQSTLLITGTRCCPNTPQYTDSTWSQLMSTHKTTYQHTSEGPQTLNSRPIQPCQLTNHHTDLDTSKWAGIMWYLFAHYKDIDLTTVTSNSHCLAGPNEFSRYFSNVPASLRGHVECKFCSCRFSFTFLQNTNNS